MAHLIAFTFLYALTLILPVLLLILASRENGVQGYVKPAEPLKTAPPPAPQRRPAPVLKEIA